MKHLTHLAAIASFAMLFALFGCNAGSGPSTEPTSTQRAIYHWKTTFNPTASELQFIEDHGISRLYLHLFDVVPNEQETDVIPSATLRFLQPMPSGIEVVPTVYVSHEAMDLIDNHCSESAMAQRIYQRIKAMMLSNGISYREIQLDCDGGASLSYSTNFLASCLLSLAHTDSIQLSTTVRLSQLSNIDRLPPCDRYMLMLYNTGSLQKPQTRNSILDYDDAKPYIQKLTLQWLDTLAARGIRIDCAYPLYGWGVAFNNNGQFSHLVPPMQLPAQTCDTLRVEWGEMSAIRQVQQALADKMHQYMMGAVAIYHLDSTCLAHYSSDEVESLWQAPVFSRKPKKQIHPNQ